MNARASQKKTSVTDSDTEAVKEEGRARRLRNLKSERDALEQASEAFDSVLIGRVVSVQDFAKRRHYVEMIAATDAEIATLQEVRT